MSKLAEKLSRENLQTNNPYLDLGNCDLDGTEDELYKPLLDVEHIETLTIYIWAMLNDQPLKKHIK